MPALRTGVLNYITDILVYYACSQGRSNIHVTVIFPELYAALRAGVLNIHICYF